MAKQKLPRVAPRAMTPAASARRLTLSVSEQLNQEVTLAAVRENYGMKGKSRWIGEAIVSFLDDPGWLDALEADRIAAKEKPITVVLSPEVHEVLVAGVRRLLDEKPLARHPQNQIIRGAMLWRVMGLDSRPLRSQMARARMNSEREH